MNKLLVRQMRIKKRQRQMTDRNESNLKNIIKKDSFVLNHYVYVYIFPNTYILKG